MNLFLCHAVMPREGHEDTHVVRTCVVIARTWQDARARVVDALPGTEFVTVPCAAPDVLETATTTISRAEFEDLRSACAWNEGSIDNVPESSGRVVMLGGTNRSG